MSRDSFVGLRRARDVRRIEIPMIQRDYAQGRKGAAPIRDAFLDVLRDAAMGTRSVHLDFVYGELVEDKLVPLDGQQRLTALFLLHWYVAARAGIAPEEAAKRLPALTYETRYSSKVFCLRLASERPSFPLEPHPGTLSAWLVDRSWFVRAWRHDPTIESMLVVLDALDARLRDTDCALIWERLLDDASPPITFDFLSIRDLGLTDELYVKMNSRGKPLTTFENFKASLEDMIRGVSADLHREVSRKLDNQWCDAFWRLRGQDNTIDDKFLSYFLFATDMIGHRSGRTVQTGDAPLVRARAVFASDHPDAADNVRGLIAAFDVWDGRDIAQLFRDLFTNTGHEAGKVALFDDVQLFDACCNEYAGRGFALRKVVLLHAVVRHLTVRSADAGERLRTLRNLLFNAENELRQATLPELLSSAERIVDGGMSSQVTGFNRRQMAEENAKVALVAATPDVASALRQLEDHPLLQGCLASFDLEPSRLAERVRAFDELFLASGVPSEQVVAALLAKGNYARELFSGRFQFGVASRVVWRELLTGADVSAIKAPLQALLDELGSPREGTLDERLSEIIENYLSDREAKREFDWRYYFVKYRAMRRGASGIYASAARTMGFNVCMLEKSRLTGWYRDPFLTAIYELAGRPDGAREPWFKQGYPSDARWLEIESTGAGMRCVEDGFELRAPADADLQVAFAAILERHGADENGLVRVPHLPRPDGRVDTVDRVVFGAELLKELVGGQ